MTEEKTTILTWIGGSLGTAVIGLLSRLTYGWIKTRSSKKRHEGQEMTNGHSIVNRMIECVVIEDDINDAALLLKLLAPDKAQQRIKVFTDPQDAERFLFKTGDYTDRLPLVALRVILLDLSIRGASGIDLLRKIKTDKTLGPIPVVVYSGSAREKDLLECYHLGANSFVQKTGDYEKMSKDVADIKRYWLGTNQIFLFEDRKDTTLVLAKTS